MNYYTIDVGYSDNLIRYAQTVFFQDMTVSMYQSLTRLNYSGSDWLIEEVTRPLLF